MRRRLKRSRGKEGKRKQGGRRARGGGGVMERAEEKEVTEEEGGKEHHENKSLLNETFFHSVVPGCTFYTPPLSAICLVSFPSPGNRSVAWGSRLEHARKEPEQERDC